MSLQVCINVSQLDIDEGRRGDCNHCPIALAVNRELAGAYRAKVGLTDVYIFDFTSTDNEPRKASITMPDEAIEFRRHFDFHRRLPEYRGDPKPVKFFLSIPEEFVSIAPF